MPAHICMGVATHRGALHGQRQRVDPCTVSRLRSCSLHGSSTGVGLDGSGGHEQLTENVVDFKFASVLRWYMSRRSQGAGGPCRGCPLLTDGYRATWPLNRC